MLKNKKDNVIIYHGLRWDYMNNNVLTSTAMLSAFWEKEKRDIFALLLPFVKYAIAKTTNVEEAISQQKVKEYLEGEFGYKEMPINTINMILKRLSPKTIRLENRKYYLGASLADEVGRFEKERTQCRERTEKVAIALTSYLNERLLSKCTQDEALNLLTDFFSINGLCVIDDARMLELLKSKDNERMYYVAQFIIKESNDNTLIFDYILSMTKGFFVSTAISLQPQNMEVAQAKFKGLKCYIDTKIIMCALGMNSAEECIAAKELLSMLREKGAKLYCFEHTYHELYSIVDAYKNSLRYLNPSKGHSVHTLEGWDKAEYTPDDVEIYQATLRNKIEKINIDIVQAPDCTSETKKYPVSYSDFESYLSSKIFYANRGAVGKDINSVVSVLLLRDGFCSSTIEDCGYIFVTSNIKLAKLTNAYLRKNNIINHPYVAPVIIDTELSSIVWLKCCASHDGYPKYKLIEHAAAALGPSEEIVEIFKQKVDKIRDGGGLTEEEAIAIKTNYFSKRVIAEVVHGDPSKVNEATVYKVKERYEAYVLGDTKEELEEAQRKAKLNANMYQKEAERYVNEARKNKEILKRMIDNIEKSEKRTEAIISKIFKVINWVFIVALLAIAVAFSLRSNLGKHWRVIIISLAGAIFDVLDTTIPKFRVISKFGDRIAHKISARIADRKRLKYEKEFGDLVIK